jgi:hypothetical protein
MARLTAFSRILIVLAVVALAYFGIRHFFPNIGKGITTNNTTTTTTTTNTNTTSDEARHSNTTTTDNTDAAEVPTEKFTYTPPEPVGGKLRGVVELGASGFNSFIIRMDNQKNWKLEKADYGASLLYENMTTANDVKTGLKSYIGDMLSFGVSGKDIHFVISSGAKKVEATAKIIAELKKMGYVVNEVTPEQEGKLALKAAMPREYENRSFVVDIGSGNTKISWPTASGSLDAIEAPGAKYFQNNQSDDAVYSETKAKSKQVPKQQREVCFIIGGVPYELAKQTRQGKERYTTLKVPSGYTANGEKQRCGLNIYQAIYDGTGCQQYVFDWDANFTIGRLLELK